MTTPTVAFLARHPVKGLSPEPLQQVRLTREAHFPGDRLYAIENGPSGFDAGQPEHQPKFKFMVLMRMPALAQLKTRYDDATRVLTLRKAGHLVAAGDLGTEEGRAAIEAWLAAAYTNDLRGAPRILTAPPNFRFMDSRSGYVSLLNLASVRALAAKAGRPEINPARFRANIAIEGLPPWGEFDLVGKDIRIGGATLQIIKRTERCAATHADPVRGLRDLDVVGALLREFGHTDCGVYAKVVNSGEVSLGDPISA